LKIIAQKQKVMEIHAGKWVTTGGTTNRITHDYNFTTQKQTIFAMQQHRNISRSNARCVTKLSQFFKMHQIKQLKQKNK